MTTDANRSRFAIDTVRYMDGDHAAGAYCKVCDWAGTWYHASEYNPTHPRAARLLARDDAESEGWDHILSEHP